MPSSGAPAYPSHILNKKMLQIDIKKHCIISKYCPAYTLVHLQQYILPRLLHLENIICCAEISYTVPKYHTLYTLYGGPAYSLAHLHILKIPYMLKKPFLSKLLSTHV